MKVRPRLQHYRREKMVLKACNMPDRTKPEGFCDRSRPNTSVQPGDGRNAGF